MSFAGKRVLCLESRRATETAELIRRNGGEPLVAPSLREIPLEDNPEAFQFAVRLLAGEFDMVIFLTGVGTRQLMKVLATRLDPAEILAAFRKITIVARGPKPSAALREFNVPVHINVPEPNTWRELLAATDGRPERRIAIQEYGKPAVELVAGLQARGADVTTVRVYSYGLPEDLGPLRNAITSLSQGGCDVVMFTTSQQVDHLIQVAREMGMEGAVIQALRDAMIASIGPTTTEALNEYGLTPDLAPSHPKLGILVKEAAEQAEAILCRKKK